MQANLEKLDKNHVAMEIALDPTEVDTALGEAYQKVVGKVKISGFRQGKAPRPILEAHYGKEVLYQDAMDILIPKAYQWALTHHDVTPIGQPELSVVQPLEQGKAFVYKATVQVLPEVGLGKYIGVKAEKPNPKIGEEEADRQLAVLREQYA